MLLLSWVRFIPWYDIGDIMMGAACGAGNANPSGPPDFTSGFHRDPVICVSLSHVIDLFFGFWIWIFPSVWLLGIYIFYFYIMIGCIKLKQEIAKKRQIETRPIKKSLQTRPDQTNKMRPDRTKTDQTNE